jgi:hypothetical protein
MKKTSVYLEPEVDRALDQIAKAERRSKAAVIRDALAARASRSAKPKIGAIGVGHGPGDVADNVDRHLAETGFGEA